MCEDWREPEGSVGGWPLGTVMGRPVGCRAHGAAPLASNATSTRAASAASARRLMADISERRRRSSGEALAASPTQCGFRGGVASYALERDDPRNCSRDCSRDSSLDDDDVMEGVRLAIFSASAALLWMRAGR